MVVITCNLTADIGPTQYLCDVFGSWWDLQMEDKDTDVILLSGSHEARVHRAILLLLSPFLHGLVHQAAPSCPCSTPAITLPEVRGDTLAALVELAYTGRSKVESKKVKEEFAELIELLQIGLDVQYEEISSHEREDPNQVAVEATAADENAAADTRRKYKEKAPADIRRKDEEKAAVDKRKDEEKAAADKRRKDEEKAASDIRRKDEEKAASDIRRKDEEKAASDKRRKDEEKAVSDKRRKDKEKAASDKRIKDEEKVAADKRMKDEEKAAADKRRNDEEKSAQTMRKIEQKDKSSSFEDKEAGFEKAETEVTRALDLQTNLENEPAAAANEKEVKETDATKKIKMVEKTDSVEFSKLIDEASSIKVGESWQTRGRRRKSRGSTTVKENETIPFLMSVSQNRREKSPDSILAKTTRNQKRKIQTILGGNDEIDATPEPKKKRIDLCIQKTEERFVNIHGIVNNSTDSNLYDEDDVNENSNDMVQDTIKVNSAKLENSQMSIMSDEGFLLDGSKDGWDKENERNDKEAKFVCPFCEKKYHKKGGYEYHLSWNHFQEEICEKFPGLECPACKKRFVRKSNYVSHLGSFHKVIDGLMAMAYEDKMALIREAQQRKEFASPKHEGGGDNVRRETPRRNNANTPNKGQKTSSCKEEGNKIVSTITEESSEIVNADTGEGNKIANAITEESSDMVNADTEEGNKIVNAVTEESTDVTNAITEESSDMVDAATPTQNISNKNVE